MRESTWPKRAVGVVIGCLIGGERVWLRESREITNTYVQPHRPSGGDHTAPSAVARVADPIPKVDVLRTEVREQAPRAAGAVVALADHHHRAGEDVHRRLGDD